MALTRRSAALLFAGLVVSELLHAIAAAWQHRIPLSHDGFQYFTLHYFFLNNAIQSGEVAQWIPYMNQGTIASLWRGIQATLLQNVLLACPWLVAGADLLTIYHTGMFVDAMVLLTGTWLCARRFFSPATTFLVSAAIVGGSVWIDQPYWNFKLYYAVPLLLHVGHRFLETGRWRWMFLAGNLLAMQMLGSLPYLIPVTSFTVALYFVAYGLTHHALVRKQLASLGLGWSAAAALAGAGLSLAAAYVYFTSATAELVSYNPYRNADGSTTLDVFLTYGGSTDLRKWIDMVLNLSPWMDFTLYSGAAILPLAIASLVVTDRHRLHFLVVSIGLLLFTLGTPLSAALYYAWPGMKFFRHIGLVSPLVRIFICFAAGATFEAVFMAGADAPRRRLAAISLIVMLVVSGSFAFSLSTRQAPTRELVDVLSNPGIDRPAHVHMPDELARRLKISAVAAWAAALIAAVAVFVQRSREMSSGRIRPLLIGAFLLLMLVDVYHFKFHQLFGRSEVVGRAQLAVMRPAALVYVPRRAVDLKEIALAGGNPRLNATLEFSSMFRYRLQGRASNGAQYWTNDAFVFADEAGSTFQVDSWLKPFDELLRMYWRVPIDSSGFPPGIDLRALDFPLTHPAAARIAGVTADKIRGFSRAFSAESAASLPTLMTDLRFRGDLLFLLGAGGDMRREDLRIHPAAAATIGADDSVPFRYSIEEFTANRVRLKVDNPGGARWLEYADVWHSMWRATVNGREVPVYRSNMAYKAVPLNRGSNAVEFVFGSRLVALLAGLFAVCSAMWLGFTAWAAASILRSPAAAGHEFR